MLLIKDIKIYNPEYIGKKDILICNSKIELIKKNIDNLPVEPKVINGNNLILIPGLIDQHVHVTGGGGEGGFHTRTPEIQLSELISAGITTVVGLLGTDSITRTVENLYAKISSLNEEGISSYMLTGSYDYPSPTITGKVENDIVFIKEILGLKLAISDHRSPNVSVEDLSKIASKVRVSSMVAGKPGIITLHIGDEGTGLKPILEVVNKNILPIKMFKPTHVNRNPNLLEEGFEYLKLGGYVDYTCGLNDNYRPGTCILEAIDRGLDLEYITISSDGQGSWSNYDEFGNLKKIGVSSVKNIFDEFVYMVKELNIPLEKSLKFFTSNVSKSLGLFPDKGFIAEKSDADILLLDKNSMNIHTVIANGEILMEDGILKKQGTYESII